jgi:alkylhydroperoxidase family enzyme
MTPWPPPPSASLPKSRARGHVSEEDLRAVKSAGYDDAQVIEIVLHVALNTWTNYLNEVAKTDIDFPVVTARTAH